MKQSKNSTEKVKFYLPILDALKHSTNLTKIREKLGISKQNLNFYIRQLKKSGFVVQKGRGWYEVVKKSKNSTKYGQLLSKDISRGHAYVWNVKHPQEIKGWNNRVEILKNKGIHFTLVGALKTTPRIMVLGRKIWLCNDHLRIFDKEKQSYYGNTAIDSRKLAFQELLLIVGALETKFGVILRPFEFQWNKEHYALIKNDLAIEHNRKGEIVRISDEQGEWLIIDDSMSEGGELENIGHSAFVTNIPMQKWWNEQKQTKFEVTPNFILKTMNGIQQNQGMFAKNMESHINAIQELAMGVKELREEVKKLGSMKK